MCQLCVIAAKLFCLVAVFATAIAGHETTTSASNMTIVDTTSCDEMTNSCFREPEGCPTGSCQYLLTWNYEEGSTSVSFELEAPLSSENSWVAFGISTDQEMGNDSVVECVYDETNKTYKVRMSWNNEHSNTLLPNDQIGLVPQSTSAGYVNGRIVCEFELFINVSTDKVFALNSASYYIFIAHGLVSGGFKQIHSARTFSAEPVNFVEVIEHEEEDSLTTKNLMKAHGIVMVLAWLVFSSFGMLMPRYCKSVWPDTKWWGKLVWFQIHRLCMVLTLLLTAAGFIMIFAGTKEYVSDLSCPTCAHPPLGIAVMGLVLINPIMALFRCEPNSKFRFIFNIFHFGVGMLAHLAAVVTIFLGLYMEDFELPLWTKGVMATYICFHALIEVILAIHLHVFSKARKNAVSDETAMETYESDGHAPTGKRDSDSVDSDTAFTSVILAVHLCGVLAFAVAISAQIGLSTVG